MVVAVEEGTRARAVLSLKGPRPLMISPSTGSWAPPGLATSKQASSQTSQNKKSRHGLLRRLKRVAAYGRAETSPGEALVEIPATRCRWWYKTVHDHRFGKVC